MKVALLIEVDYDASGYIDEADALAAAQEHLHEQVNNMIDEGSGLYGSTSLTVENWHVSTDRVEE